MGSGLKDGLQFFGGLPTAGAIIPIDIWGMWSDEEVTKKQERPSWADPKCECGAEKTVNKNLHATWCPKYSPYKK